MNEPDPIIAHLQQRPDGTWFRLMAPFMGAPRETWWQEESEDGAIFYRTSENRGAEHE